jgi:hypothetical protein
VLFLITANNKQPKTPLDFCCSKFYDGPPITSDIIK